ncbi:sensitivity to high expression protein she9 [Mortierella alpina]|uniref:Sensitive to high expression protein 9, mitochondrial n=1 Tax=Mortierella alpina TaxID=64518 RepID=A0A9P6JDM1_MORAP|nr:sensitivity to high expression protein she9 [Mortierella alpina]
MASHLRLIRPAGTLAAAKSPSTQLLFPSSNLRLSVSNGCTVTHPRGPDSAILLAQRAFSTSLASKSNSNNSNSNNNNPSSSSSSGTSGSKPAAAVSASEVAEAEAKKKVIAETEKKRIEAQDAALKEILESAAAEKRKLEQEAIKVAQEKARKAALEAEAAAAAKARTAAKAKADADAAAKAQLEAERQAAIAGKSTPPSKHQPKQEQYPYQTSWSHSQAPGSSDVASNSIVSGSNKSSATDSLRDGAARVSASSASQQTPSITNGQQAKQAGSQNSVGEDPLEPFKAKLLPYKRSLESSTEYIRSALPDSLRQLSESMKRKDYHDTIALLAGHLNTFTGYNAINDLKHKVIAHGDRLDEARIKLVQAKQAYEDAIAMRSDTQKAINDLLQRKHLWSPDDVIRFTDLYRSEHANEQAEQKTKAQYKQAEAEVEERSRQLTTVITERYHEEQVWSDKIRAASTYGTWGLIGVNVMAFLVVQAFVEPRRRRKQVERYEELVQDLTERGILPNNNNLSVSASTGGGMVAGAPAVTAKPSANHESSESEDKDALPVAVGGALLGGEDVLLKIIQSTERQEERLDRMESLLLKQIPMAQVRDDQKTVSAGNFVVADDGSLLLMPEDDDNNGPESVDLAKKAWREEIHMGSRSGGMSGLDPTPRGNRLSRVLKDGDAEVSATRRDFLLSGLGGAIIGGLVTVVVMMNY